MTSDALRRLAALCALAAVLAAAVLPAGQDPAAAHAEVSSGPAAQDTPNQMCDAAAELVWQFFTTWMTSPDDTATQQFVARPLRETIEGRPNGVASLFSTQSTLPPRPAEVSVAIASSEVGSERLVYASLVWFLGGIFSGQAITVVAEEGVLKVSAIRSTGASIATGMIGERRFRAPNATAAPTATPTPGAAQPGLGTATSRPATQTPPALCVQAETRAQAHTAGVQATAEAVAAQSTAAAQAEASTLAQAQSASGRAQARATAQASPALFVALTAGGDLVRFSSAAPGSLTGTARVTGLLPGETLLGIDFRSADRRFYGVGSAGWVYAVDPVNGAAARVGSEPVSPVPAGPGFGLAFRPITGTPAPDQPGDLHLFDTTGRELVISVDPVLCDGCRRAAPGATRADQRRIVAAAYESGNPFSVFVIDSASDTLFRASFDRTTALFASRGPLGVDTSDLAGLAIDPSGSVAYAALTDPEASSSKLYTVDLSTGAAREVGTIGGAQPVHSLAIAPASLAAGAGMRLPATGAGPADAPDGAGASGVVPATAALGALATAWLYALRRRQRTAR